MASNPLLYQLDDQSDDDFFDKLVDDDFVPHKFATLADSKGVGNLSSGNNGIGNLNGKGIGNLSIGEKGIGNLSIGEKGIGNLSVDEKGIGNLSVDEKGVVNLKVDEKGIGNLSVDEKGVGNLKVDEKGIGNLSVDEKGIGNLSVDEKGIGNLSFHGNVIGDFTEPGKVGIPVKVVGLGDRGEFEDSKVGLGLDNEFVEAKVIADLSVDEKGVGSLSIEPVKVVGFGGRHEFEHVKVGSGFDNEFGDVQAFRNLSMEPEKVDIPAKVLGFGNQGESEDVKLGLGLNNEFDEVQAFGSLSIDEEGGEGSKDSGKDGVGRSSEGLVVDRSVNEVNDNGGGLEVEGDSNGGKDGGSGVKQVSWSSFFPDLGQNDGGDVGSEFFTGGDGEFSGIGDHSGDFIGNFDGSLAGGTNVIAGNQEGKSGSLSSSLTYAQYFEGHAYSGSMDNSNYKQDMDSSQYWEHAYSGSVDNSNAQQDMNSGQYWDHAYSGSVDNSNAQQDMNSSQYWESLYPGWRYDSNTGQWYQVDSQDSVSNVQASHDAATSTSELDVVPEQKSEIAYLQQTVQPVTVTEAERGTTENVSSWNQTSQGNDEWKKSELNSGFPEHMLFYPEHPGWYFDMIAQEWRTLESYTSSVQLTGQTHDQQKNDGPNSTFSHYNDNSSFGEYGETDNYGSPAIASQSQGSSLATSCESSIPHDINSWQPDTPAKIEPVLNFSRNLLANNAYSSMTSVSNQTGHQNSHSLGAIPSYGNTSSQTQAEANGSTFPKFVPNSDLTQPFSGSQVRQNEGHHFSNGFYGSREPTATNQQSFQSGQQFPFVSTMERSSAGRPAHALVTFAFGGKLVVVRSSSSFSNASYGSQDVVGGSISVLNLAEVVMESTDASGIGVGSCGYFNALCKESFPGPLAGGNAGAKELNKWIDERIENSESPDINFGKCNKLKLLFSLLKIACQHYGKLRSPFGTDTTMRESDTPEIAVAKLFASAKNDMQFNQYGALNQCMQSFPSEAQIQATASEVQNLLVSGRKQEALQCAQEGQLWGPALVLASQLGDQFYMDAVKQMALRQLVAGSPLRTLCLLIAGQPAEVFVTDTNGGNFSNAINFPEQQTQYGANVMLDDWEENLALITANRTKDDELVIIHLGDCLWKERNNIVAAHICYLVAEANFESHSDGARMCLVGADHWKNPRTYASPEAIQRTELYEYSKVLGNSQFILQPFQPYKLIYAHMLAEVGRVPDSLKYCQAVLKSLKTGRAPEVETWKQLVLSLEERIRAHQQGGYAGNLAPKKLVGKLLNLFDSTAHKVVGGIPPPAPSTAHVNVQGNEHFTQPTASRVLTSHSTMAMSSLMPSASMELMSSSDGNGTAMQNRSVSEPDFSQVDSSNDKQSSNAQGKPSSAGVASRFSRFGFGSQILQKTVGLVLRPRSGPQAKLGDENKFYYNEKLKMWVEEGAEPPAEEAALPPPPTSAPFQNGMSDFNSTTVLKNEVASPYSSPEYRSPTPVDHSSGIPPIAPSSNQFSARGRMGVRSRYVDTFNKGGGPAANSFRSSSIPSVKPTTIGANAKFFIPTPAAPTEQAMEAIAENKQENMSYTANDPVQNCGPSPSVAMQRFPSMDNISMKGQSTSDNGPLSSDTRRTASWSGSLGDASGPKMGESKQPRKALGMSPLAFSQNDQTSLDRRSSGSFGDDLHEVEL